jgi:hypothetical protein
MNVLNETLIRDLETLSTERQRALMLWYVKGQTQLEAPSEKVSAILSEIETLEAEACYDLLQHLDIRDMVRFTVLNEFGPLVAKKSTLETIVNLVTEKHYGRARNS